MRRFRSRFAKCLRVVVSSRRPILLVSWLWPPPGAVQLTIDGCFRGNPRMAASDSILRDD